MKHKLILILSIVLCIENERETQNMREERLRNVGILFTSKVE